MSKEHKCKENVGEYGFVHKIYKDNLDEWILESDSAYHNILDINYCPFCGVKL